MLITDKYGCRRIRFCTDARGATVNGIPDICGYLPNGKALYIEVKKPGKKPTALQKGFLDSARDQNCAVCVAHSIDDVRKLLQEEGY